MQIRTAMWRWLRPICWVRGHQYFFKIAGGRCKFCWRCEKRIALPGPTIRKISKETGND